MGVFTRSIKMGLVKEGTFLAVSLVGGLVGCAVSAYVSQQSSVEIKAMPGYRGLILSISHT